MVIEHFVPNEYVADCALSSQDLWRVKVEDINRIGDYASDFIHGGHLYFESNGVSGLQRTGDHPDRELTGKQLNIPDHYIHEGYVYFNNPGQPGYFTDNDAIEVPCVIVGEVMMYYNGSFHLGSNAYYATDVDNVVPANAS